MNLTNTQLGQICRILNGRAYSQHELLQQGKYPVLRVGNFFSSDRWYYSDLELDADKYCDNGDLLFAWSASFGPKIWDGSKVIYHYHIWKIVPNDQTDKYYLYYWLKNSVDALTAGTHGSVMAHITKSDMEHMPISVPDLETQKKIGYVLHCIDNKISLNTAINNNLEQQAQALITDYASKTPGITTLGALLSFVNGFAFKSGDYLAKGLYKIITIKNVQDGLVDSQGAACMDDLPAKLPSDCKLNIGDVLLSLTGNVGRVGIVTENNLLLNQRVAKVKSKNNDLLPFIYFVLRLPAMKTEMENISKGTAQQNLSPIETLKLQLNFDESTAVDLSHTLSSMFNQIVHNMIQNRNLSEIRDALLPKLMSGEIDVSEVDISDPSCLDKSLFNKETE
jgi:type I restriction enzyme S subunit